MQGRFTRVLTYGLVALPLLCMGANCLSEVLYSRNAREVRQRRAADREVAIQNGTLCDDVRCRRCSLLNRLDEACGAQLIAQCGADAGHHFFTGADPFPHRVMFSEETQCADGLVALTSAGSLEAPPMVRHIKFIEKQVVDERTFEVSLTSNRARSSSGLSCGSCEAVLRISASGWVRVQ